MAFVLFLCALHCVLSVALSFTTTTTPFVPSSWPIAVKGPYLNTWQPGSSLEGTLSQSALAFWPSLEEETDWTCIAVVDSTPYMIMGVDRPQNVTLANQTAVSFTATRMSFALAAGPVAVNATFLSPVTPNDLTRQSLPFSYFFLDILSQDEATHDIRIYTSIIPQWMFGNAENINATGSLIDSTDFVGLQMQMQSPQPFVEIANHAQDVIGIFAMKSSSNVRYQIGSDLTVRTFGINATGLQNTVELSIPTYFDAYAISLDLGSTKGTTEPIMWTLGMLRDPSMNVSTASGSNQLRSSYYWSNFSTISEIVAFVLDDFDAALASADAFDQMIMNVSLSHVDGYPGLLSLAARQLFGTLEITVSKSSDGNWNQTDIMIFSKDMGDVSSSGTSGGTNVVDVLYAGFPAILYLNPDLCQYLLRPILASQVNNGDVVGQAYAPQNLGSQFPSTSANTSQHNLGIEESGNMLIMVLAHFQRTGNLSIIRSYYPLLKSWADYLVDQTLNAGTTSLSDGITSFNQTNLVLKGIIGISAMSSISSANTVKDDQMAYQTIAQQYMQIWLDGAVSQDHSHLLSSFADQNSSGLVYNMYADKLLGLGLVPSNVSVVLPPGSPCMMDCSRSLGCNPNYTLLCSVQASGFLSSYLIFPKATF
ncbi:hypothetical protein SCHPADRAFT_824120 [Schizopora paradoxa]|uniref:DUF1793-domain-containing protein n=1 Tax=Schizopora paradoxa TaxID=27342 RepID=A0A0H2SFC8_9AGAM|nr:hypothetical protein SCHPADRAFT_824120 [Schizopora paradoxa]